MKPGAHTTLRAECRLGEAADKQRSLKSRKNSFYIAEKLPHREHHAAVLVHLHLRIQVGNNEPGQQTLGPKISLESSQGLYERGR